MIQMVPEERFAVIIQTNRSGETMTRTRATGEIRYIFDGLYSARKL